MKFWTVVGALNAILAIGFGAFGAHGLRSRGLSPERLASFDTASRYQMYHALGLLAVGWLASQKGAAAAAPAGWCMLAGIVLFSGSLYAMVLTGARWLGPITPLGGLAFMAAWAAFAWAASR